MLKAGSPSRTGRGQGVGSLAGALGETALEIDLEECNAEDEEDAVNDEDGRV
jgi:hypothetical protein